jgi:Spy/CpxP family protein refolding chaperone
MEKGGWNSMNGVRFGHAVCLVLLALISVGVARPEGRPPGSRRAPGGPERPEEMRQAMEQMVIARLSRALHLTEAQEAVAIPRFEELMQARREHAAARRSALGRLRALLVDETASDQEIDKALREVRAGEEDFRRREGQLRSALDDGLTRRQQARLVFFEERLHRVMQRRLREAAGRGAERRPEPGRRPDVGRRPPRPDVDGPGSGSGPEDEPDVEEDDL